MPAAALIHLEVVCPERVALDMEVEEVVLPGVHGEVGILPGHRPLITSLQDGALRVRRDGAEQVFTICRGFAEVSHDRVVVLVERCESTT